MYIIPTMLTEILYPLQDCYTPLHLAARGAHTTVVEHLLSIPGIDVNVMDVVRPQHLPRGGGRHTRGAKKGRGLRYFRYARNRLTLHASKC